VKDVGAVNVQMTSRVTRHDNMQKESILPGVKNTIAVASGKGGVGKSTVAVNLAAALAKEGAKVGLVDADLYGPSIPLMMGYRDRPLINDEEKLVPPVAHGVKVMSMGLLIQDDQPVIWRGPMIQKTIQQFVHQVDWGTLDYLIVDLPPGTSDASLTVMQSLPLSGVVLVTSPQDLAGMVVRKAAQMAGLLHIPILGLVENMSYFVCPDSGKQHEVFGASHAQKTAEAIGAPLLGRLPIDPEIAKLSDAGRIEEYPGEAFAPIAEQLVALATPARAPALPGKPG